ncbi:hypothetical protein BC834DRAFT_870723 [Gloeopeniophorella convolvens]|nr:hypothetical protein BC834DRAFT_870723 [Gloeopeniophorella convolvens]
MISRPLFALFSLALISAPFVVAQLTDTVQVDSTSTQTVNLAPPITTPPPGFGGTSSFTFDTAASSFSGFAVGSNPACYSVCLAQAALPAGCSVTDTQCQCQNDAVTSNWRTCLQTTCLASELSAAQSMLLFTCASKSVHL